MKQLVTPSIDVSSVEECSALVLATMPAVMGGLRSDLRAKGMTELSVPQFRVLMFLVHHPCASLSQVAEHMDLTLSTISKLVDGLLKRGLLQRETAVDDRRRVTLAVTTQGSEALWREHHKVIARLGELLAGLTIAEREALVIGMLALQRIVHPMRISCKSGMTASDAGSVSPSVPVQP